MRGGEISEGLRVGAVMLPGLNVRRGKVDEAIHVNVRLRRWYEFIDTFPEDIGVLPMPWRGGEFLLVADGCDMNKCEMRCDVAKLEASPKATLVAERHAQAPKDSTALNGKET